MYSGRKFYDIVPVCRQIVKQGDHCFIMVSDDKARDEVTVAFANNKKVHISRNLEYAQEGDLSAARGTLLQMKDVLAYEDETFDYCINLTEGMLPVKPREEIVDFLENNPGDYYYVDRSEKEDPELRKKTLKYYLFTNMLVFPTKKSVRRNTKAFASLLNLFGLHRKLDDEIIIGSPWFILTMPTVQILADNFAWCSDALKWSWYAEELYIPMMLNKFAPNHEHFNKDLRVVGPNGHWEESSGGKPLTKEILEQHPEALFGTQFFEEGNEEFYDEMLHLYNKNYKKPEVEEKKEYTEEEFNRLVDVISESTKDKSLK